MNEYIQEKMANFDENYEPLGYDSHDSRWKFGAPSPLSLKRWITTALSEAYSQGVQDSLKCVPDKAGFMDETTDYGWNECRKETIDNISKLKTNK